MSRISISSADKKRLRDRRAQQTVRDKRRLQIANLEERVAYCQNNHYDDNVQQLYQEIARLRSYNEILLARQARLRTLASFWDAEDLAVSSAHRAAEAQESSRQLDAERDSDASSLSLFASPAKTKCSLASPTCSNPNASNRIGVSTAAIATACPTGLPMTAVEHEAGWRMLPLNDDLPPSSQDLSCPWFAYPDKIAWSLASPSSPLDLLYGTKVNALANMIHGALLRRGLIRDPEFLALGWICYHMSKWIMTPSPAAFAKLPNYIWPVAGQKQIVHPICLDFIIWPELRMNLIRHWPRYKSNRDEMFGLLVCCMKVRWPWGESILERNDQNKLQIRPKFYETFMSAKGWGITREFIARYPETVEGMDVASIVYDLI